MKLRIAVVAGLIAASSAFSVGAHAAPSSELVPQRIIQAPVRNLAGRPVAKSAGITYHNGPIMLGTTNAYVIWYGDWTKSVNGTQIISDFLSNVGGSPYFNINTTYYNGNKAYVSNSVTLAGSTSDTTYKYGTNLTDANVTSIVTDAISSNRLPLDANGVYFVLTSGDVGESSGFLTKYCGWHTYTTYSSTVVKYSFVGDPTKNMSACSVQSTSPNGNAAVDAMISVIAHELEEAVTDPQLNAWYDTQGAENADKCAWKFGTTYTTSNGSVANMKIGTRDYLVQQNWVVTTQSCALKY